MFGVFWVVLVGVVWVVFGVGFVFGCLGGGDFFFLGSSKSHWQKKSLISNSIIISGLSRVVSLDRNRNFSFFLFEKERRRS